MRELKTIRLEGTVNVSIPFPEGYLKAHGAGVYNIEILVKAPDGEKTKITEKVNVKSRSKL